MELEIIRGRNGATDRMVAESTDLVQLSEWRDFFERADVQMRASINEYKRKELEEGIPVDGSFYRTKTALSFNNLLLQITNRRIFYLSSNEYKRGSLRFQKAFVEVSKTLLEDSLFDLITERAKSLVEESKNGKGSL